MPTVHATDKDFRSLVLESKLPVLVDFWATWCAPCRKVAPILEELSDLYAGGLVIAKVDVDHSPQVAGLFRIRSIPTLMLFQGGQPVQAIEGALPKEQLKKLLAEWLPNLGAPRSFKITVPELAVRLDAGRKTVIYDVRRPIDFGRSHLRGALNPAPEALDELLGAIGPNDLAVLICRTGEESERIAKEQSEKGRPVVALEKGLLEWEGAGKPTFSNEEEAEELARTTAKAPRS